MKKFIEKYRCTKKSYNDRQQAIKSMHKVQNIADDNKKPIRAYQCTNCGKWHLTSREDNG